MPHSLLLARLDGAPFSLPRALDRLSDRWWGLAPRKRFIAGGAIGVLALLVGVSHLAASPYGPPAPVLIAARDLDAGDQVGPDDMHRATWPQGLIPDGAVTDPAGRLTAPLPAGSALTRRHLAAAGIAGLVPTGSVAVPLPPDAVPALDAGHRVDLIGRDVNGTGVVLGRDAQVLVADEVGLWVAVDRHAAADVAAAATAGQISVAVLRD